MLEDRVRVSVLILSILTENIRGFLQPFPEDRTLNIKMAVEESVWRYELHSSEEFYLIGHNSL
jgi:hypothetical protein